MIAVSFWIGKNCVRHPRISGGVAAMLRHLNASLAERRQGSCTLEEFIEVLRDDERLQVIEVAGVLLVPGLGLKSDWNLIRQRKKYEAEVA
jgi:hypothetical protein